MIEPSVDSFQWCRFTADDGVEHARVGAVHMIGDVPHVDLVMAGSSFTFAPTAFGPVVPVPSSFDGEPTIEQREAFAICGKNLHRALDMMDATGDDLVACAHMLHGASNPWATDGGGDEAGTGGEAAPTEQGSTPDDG